MIEVCRLCGREHEVLDEGWDGVICPDVPIGYIYLLNTKYFRPIDDDGC